MLLLPAHGAHECTCLSGVAAPHRSLLEKCGANRLTASSVAREVAEAGSSSARRRQRERDVAIDEGWTLLRIGLLERVPPAAHDAVAALLEQSVFERCCTALERHLLPVELPSPLVLYCTRLARCSAGSTNADSDALRLLLAFVRKRWPQHAARASGNNLRRSTTAAQLDALLALEAAQELEEAAWDAQVKVTTAIVTQRRLGLLQQCATSLFPATPYVACALCAVRCVHSCVPSAQLQLLPIADHSPSRGDTATPVGTPLLPQIALVALREKQCESELPSVAWIGVPDADVEQRGVALRRLFGDSFLCSCARCCYERNGAPDATSTPCIMLARDAMEDGRTREAVTMLRLHLTETQDDGDAWVLLGTALLNLGRWSEAHAAWRSGAKLRPNHSLLRQQHAKDQHYCQLRTEQGGADHVEGMDMQALDASCCPCVVLPLVSAGPKAKVVQTSAPLFSLHECKEAIDAAEAHATDSGGWTTTRHHAVPTTDVPVHAVPTLLAWFNYAMRSRLSPLLEAQFGVPATDIRVHDAFLVKYTAAGGQAHLPMHTDESQLSLTIVLNSDQDDFTGGGTFFADLGRALNPPIGHVIAFDGDALHGGEPVRCSQLITLPADEACFPFPSRPLD